LGQNDFTILFFKGLSGFKSFLKLQKLAFLLFSVKLIKKE